MYSTNRINTIDQGCNKQTSTETGNETTQGKSCSLPGCVMIVGGCLIHLTLGAMFTYGNLSSYMISYIRRRSSPNDLRYVDGVWVQACMMIGQGISMFTGGLIERKLGPRITTLIGSWTLSFGVLMSYFAIQHSYIATVFTLGMISGMGTGIAYPIPLGCSMKWFPQRRGLISAVIIAAFSSGPLVFNQVITAYINPNNDSPDEEVAGEQYFTQDDLLDRVPCCFLILGGIYAVLQLVCSLVVIDPTKEKKETGRSASGQVSQIQSNEFGPHSEAPIHTDDGRNDNPRITVEVTEAKPEEIPPLRVLKSKNFYVLWFIFLCGGEGCVFILAQYKNYGLTFIADDQFLAIVGSVASVVSSVGCILWGLMIDRFSFKVVAGCISLGAGCLIASFLATEYAGKTMFFIWVCLMYFHFAGIFTIMTPAISRLYGNKYVATNYGLLFTSQIITGVTSAFLGQALKDAIGWRGLFILSAGFNVVGIILIYFMETKTPAGDSF